MVMYNRELRYFWLKLVIAGMAIVFVSTLFFIQIVEHDQHVRDANAMRVKQYELLAKRGEVYFMDGKDDVSPAIMNERTTAGAKIDDPFNGMEVLFNNTVTGMLVGDLDGVVANFPEGEDFRFIVDETSLAERDLVKIVGKILAAIHLVRPNGFAVVTAE